MDKLNDLVECKSNCFSLLDVELNLISEIIGFEDVQRVRDQILILKRLWKDFSKACGSIRAIYVLSENEASALRIKNDKRAMSARVSSAVLDLNECLSRLGQDQESALAESTLSSISSKIFLPVDNAIEKSNAWILTAANDTAIGPVTCEESDPCGAGEGLVHSKRTRPNCPTEAVLNEQVLKTTTELLRWFVTVESAEEFSAQVASIYLGEVEGCFNCFKAASNELSDYHIRRGEINSARQLRESIGRNLTRCDRVVEKLRSCGASTERHGRDRSSVTEPMVNFTDASKRVTFDSVRVCQSDIGRPFDFSGFAATLTEGLQGTECQLLGRVTGDPTPTHRGSTTVPVLTTTLSPFGSQVTSHSVESLNTKLVFSNVPNTVSVAKLTAPRLDSLEQGKYFAGGAESHKQRQSNYVSTPQLDRFVSSSPLSAGRKLENERENSTLRKPELNSWNIHNRDGSEIPSKTAEPLRGSRVYNDTNLSRIGSFLGVPSAETRSSAAATLHLQSTFQLRKDLRKGLGEPFGGRPELYRSWRNKLTENLENADCTPSMTMDILLANTTGTPKRLVTQLYHSELEPEEQVKQVWVRFQNRYGSHTTVFRSYLEQLQSFPKIVSSSNVEKMDDLLILVQSLAASSLQSAGLTFLRSEEGLSSIWEKMPDEFIGKWRDQSGCLRRAGCSADIHRFLSFMQEYVDNRAHFKVNPMVSNLKTARSSSSFRTEILARPQENKEDYCIYHDTASHKLDQCQAFSNLTYKRKMQWLFQGKRCYICLNTGHQAKDCHSIPSCTECDGKHHHKIHPPPMEKSVEAQNFCAVLCGTPSESLRSCSKTVAVEVRVAGRSDSVVCYCIVDEQSNSSFCHPSLVEQLQPDVCEGSYTLSTMSGLKSYTRGSSVENLEVKGLYEKQWIRLPSVWTHPFLPDTKSEIATREVVAAQPHLRDFVHHFPRETLNCEVLLLVGHNCGEAMRTQQYGDHFPFVHHMVLGWSLVGPACVSDKFTDPHCFRTAVTCAHFSAEPAEVGKEIRENNPLHSNSFAEYKDDELPGFSQEDQKFLQIVSENVSLNSCGNLEIPLPIREDCYFPKNKSAVFFRTKSTLQRICKKPTLKLKCQEAMGKYIEAGHVSEIPDDGTVGDMVNYIPVFQVESPRKEKVRIVFDSAASFRGYCLNDHLLRGPDVTNSLLGVLLRFRLGSVGFAADIESMFHCFHVSPQHRDLLRFFWWKHNTPGESYSIFRSNVHVFGNRCSPAIATFGLRHAANMFASSSQTEAKEFIEHNFYVDDGLAARNTVADAVAVLKDAIEILAKGNIRLHKIVSSSPEVLKAFPPAEVAVNLEEREVLSGCSQTALGLTWHILTDHLGLRVRVPLRNFNKRGILSIINAVFDPVGLVSPVVLGGRLLQRSIIVPKDKPSLYHKFDWDDPLPEDLQPQWNRWKSQLEELSAVSVPRSYAGNSSNIVTSEIHMFSDASSDAIGFVAYLRQIGWYGEIHISFLLASSKVSPRAATSIPRLELCAALEAAKASYLLERELGVDANVFLYTDSLVVLGYLQNTSKTFSRYVTSRVAMILRHAPLERWNYIPGHLNPADIASRPHTVNKLLDSVWLRGPSFLMEAELHNHEFSSCSSNLPEVLPRSRCLHTTTKEGSDVLTRLLERFLSWKSMICIMTKVLTFLKTCRKQIIIGDEVKHAATVWMCRTVQKLAFCREYSILQCRNSLPDDSDISRLAPFLDSDGVIRVGGRLSNSSLPYCEKHPILLPKDHELTIIILKHFHELSFHQGRILTTAALRSGGFHIHRQSSVIGKFLRRCPMCRRLRGGTHVQKMSDLPSDRLERIPPFEHSGVDVCGPYLVYEGRTTRRTTASKKVWIILFTCLYSRAVHVDLLVSLDTSTFQLALRRFISFRGGCKLFRSDCGSNFVGLQNQVDLEKFISEVKEESYEWRFMPPRASHFAGVWERKIGAIKTVLDSAISLLGKRALSRDEFHTLLLETAAIVNSTPLGEISADPNDPYPVSPAQLLNLREDSRVNAFLSTNKDDLEAYGRKRWRRVQFLADQFWIRWKRDYLTAITIRRKWKKVKPNVGVGDVVLLRENSPRCSWPLGIVSSTFPGKDGLVRRVEVDCKSKIFSRAVSDIVVITQSE